MMTENKGWKSGVVTKIGKTKGGLSMLKFDRGNPKEGQTPSFLIIQMIGSVVPNEGVKYEARNWEERDKLHKHDTYYELPIPMKGDKHWDGPPEDEPKKVIPPEDVPVFLLDSDLAAAMVVVEANRMNASGKDFATYEECESWVMERIRKIVK